MADPKTAPKNSIDAKKVLTVGVPIVHLVLAAAAQIASLVSPKVVGPIESVRQVFSLLFGG